MDDIDLVGPFIIGVCFGLVYGFVVAKIAMTYSTQRPKTDEPWECPFEQGRPLFDDEGKFRWDKSREN